MDDKNHPDNLAHGGGADGVVAGDFPAAGPTCCCCGYPVALVNDYPGHVRFVCEVCTPTYDAGRYGLYNCRRATASAVS